MEVLSLVQRLAQQGARIAMRVHDLIAAAHYADVLVAMLHGQIIAQF